MGKTASKEISSMARIMTFLAWIGVALLLTWLFSNELRKQENPNETVNSLVSEGVVELVLVRNRMGHYVANGSINQQPVRFILDTGATYVSIPERVADELGLSRGAAQQTITANGVITTYNTRLEEAGVGAIKMQNVQANINPNMPGRDVLLGMSFLKNLEMIQRGNTLKLRQLSP